jgi:vacuolar protein sorting-associated protein 16
MLDDSIRLLKLQETYDKDLEPRKSYVGLSLNETLYHLILDQENSKSAKLQSAFRITDETFWIVKLRALVDGRRWDELRTWSQTKKSPIGYEVNPLQLLPSFSNLPSFNNFFCVFFGILLPNVSNSSHL